ncbi:MAG: TetR/AcrR family transcriptional regulator [Gemmatimonadota bacterium]|nr:TetR/AcrR family transcriptional regulator [Gemmatimonadota bacterium]MDE3173571.1 TetR/AcrR family transcriptional regulator [Gemmatimonadota bacterium]MDE3215710.1 TetR/AcrR family transcriptional regulator [Gemmatimonadota bacterium]
MEMRDRILEAARKIYALHGYRGATTRLIANEAGVNEVTLFRTFGSKESLFEELAQGQANATVVPGLPERPADPERELTEWCAAVLAYLTQHRSFLRKSMSEMEERPIVAEAACRGPNCASDVLAQYVAALEVHRLVRGDGEARTAISMLMASLFGDAMCREIMPDAFPEPADEAPARYARTFLRAVGLSPRAAAKQSNVTAA